VLRQYPPEIARAAGDHDGFYPVRIQVEENLPNGFETFSD